MNVFGVGFSSTCQSGEVLAVNLLFNMQTKKTAPFILIQTKGVFG